MTAKGDQTPTAFALGLGAALAISVFAFFAIWSDVKAQQGFHGEGHDKMHHWYQNLKRPDGSGISCCSEKDCRPTDARVREDGSIEAMLNGRWVIVPPNKILRNVYSPDLGSHICAPDPKATWYPKDHIFCFVFGAGV